MCLFGASFICLALAYADRIDHLLSESEIARCANEVRLCRALQTVKTDLVHSADSHIFNHCTSGCLFLVDFCLAHFVHIFITFLF